MNGDDNFKDERDVGSFFGLWKKKSQQGNNYYSGKVCLNGVEYWCNLFDNSEKRQENKNRPHLNIVFNFVDPPETADKPKETEENPDEDIPF